MPTAVSRVTFSPIEARVIRLAASPRERRRANRSARVMDRLAGRQTAPSLADPRLEALRVQAVQLRGGRAEVEPAFIAAGYTPAHADTIRAYIADADRRSAPAARRDRLAHAGGIGLALGSFAGFIGIAATCLL